MSELPKNWTKKKLKYLASVNDDVLEETTDGEFEFNYVDIGSVSYFNGIESVLPLKFSNAPSRARRLVKNGDIIVSTVRTYLKAIAIVENSNNYVVSTGFAVIRAKKIEENYLKYVVMNSEFVEEICSLSTGVSYPAIKPDNIMAIECCVPPLEIQQKITAYLDKKTSAIDTLIASYEKLLVLLAEKRQAIISEAVTKGLDTNAPMKDSGVEWIGEIPVGWEVKQIKNIAKINGRIGFKGYNATDLVDESEMGRAIVLGGTNVMPTGKIEYEKITYLSKYKYLESPEIMLKGNEILITKVGAGTGESAIYKYREERVTINPNVMLVKPASSCSNFFLLYFLLSDYNKRNIRLESMKSGAQPAINQEFIKNIRFPFPPLEIQQQIVQYLDEKTSKIDQITADTKEQIKLLKEYRQSLISEVVTGKIEV